MDRVGALHAPGRPQDLDQSLSRCRAAMSLRAKAGRGTPGREWTACVCPDPSRLQRWPSGNRLPRAECFLESSFLGLAGPQSHPQEACKARLSEEMGGSRELALAQDSPSQKDGGTP